MPSSIEEKEASVSALDSVFISSQKCQRIFESFYTVGFERLSQQKN
jgi:hypothetical protein